MAEALKEIYNQDFLKSLSLSLKENSSHFEKKNFHQAFQPDQWESLELKERMNHITHVLAQHLPTKYSEALKIIYKMAPHFTGLQGIIFPDFVQKFGLDDKHFKLSLQALKKLTPYSTSEFAIRHFILKDSEKTLGQMHEWSTDRNEHVRRLASEGMRPRLPWAIKVPVLIENPHPIIAVLENLKADSSLYVRKSVANNLNDISKDHPHKALTLAHQWIGKSETLDWITKHGLRTLLKKGNSEALALFGHRPLKVKINEFHCSKTLRVGSTLNIKAQLELKAEASVRIEYAIGFLLKNGTHFYKVFKVGERKMSAGPHVIEKSHSFKVITTRKYYPGQHYVRLILNGAVCAEQGFILKL